MGMAERLLEWIVDHYIWFAVIVSAILALITMIILPLIQ